MARWSGMSKKKLEPAKCIVCLKELERHCELSDVIGMMNDATIWRSHGNYGSTLYDPMNGEEFLEAYICDACVESRGDLIYHVKYTKKTEVKSTLTFKKEIERSKAACAKFKEEQDKKVEAARILVKAAYEKAKKESKVPCSACQGHGGKGYTEQIEFGGEKKGWTTCHACEGSGKAASDVKDKVHLMAEKKIKLTRALNLIRSTGIDGDKLMAFLKDPSRRPKDSFMS